MVILCGGESLRFRSATHDAPKTLAPIGPLPILVHIINRFRKCGHERFILCVRDSDREIAAFFNSFPQHALGVSIVPTGEEVPTGGRLKMVENLVNHEHFLVSYGDYLCDVNLNDFLNTHLLRPVVATILAVNPKSSYGILRFDPNSFVYDFQEKPKLEHWVNAGLFCFSHSVFDYLNEHTVLETEGLSDLIRERQLQAYQHFGFWQSMDTPKEHQLLQNIWDSGNAPWLT